MERVRERRLTATDEPPGRSREAAALVAFLYASDEWPRGIVIEGEAGIGKTTLWRRAVDEATALPYTVLVAAPAQAESRLALAGLGDLFADAYPEVESRLPEPQRHALAAALLIERSSDVAHDRRTLGVAVLSMLRELAASQPVLIAVDDVQWLDAASSATLAFALRRLKRASVALLLARRTAEATENSRFESDMGMPVERLELGPISIGALHALVIERLGTVVSRPRLRRLHELSRGNPFLALELMRAVQAGRVSLDGGEPVTADLERLLGMRLGALPDATRRVLVAIAASSTATLDLVDRLEEPNARATLEPAVRGGVVSIDNDVVHFTHPLLASTAYGSAAAGDRRQVHATLARIADDRQERARHAALAADEPDAAVAAAVEQAADVTFRRGAPAAAAELAALAVRLTPVADADAGRRRTALQAEYLFEAGDPGVAATLLEHVIAATPPGRERAALLALLARIRHFGDDVEAGVELERRALTEAAGDDRLLAGINEGLAWGLFLGRVDLAGAARHARAAVHAARRAGDDVALAEGLAAQAITSLAIGTPAPRALADALELEPQMLELRVLRHPSYAHGYVLACTDQLDEAAAVFHELLRRAADNGDESAVPPILIQLATVEILRGDWASAHEHVQAGLAMAAQVGQRPSHASLLSRSAVLAAYRGQLDLADELAAEALTIASSSSDQERWLAVGPTRGGELAAWALGMAALARRDYEQAWHYLGSLSRFLLDGGMREPGELRFLPDAVEALLGLERVDEADDLVDIIEANGRRAGRQSTIGVALRCRALVLALRHDNAALEIAAEAAEVLGHCPLPIERARALLVLGELQRRARQRAAARSTLAGALEEFDRLGAVVWAARCREETSRLGGRTPGGADLTPTESRVAELVAEGLANKEVAHALGVTPKTIEVHLTHIYAKLEVASRTELVRRLSVPEWRSAGVND